MARPKSHRTGLFAETKAVWFLRLRGWRILERRWRSAYGEVDVIAKRGRRVIFVEVKARKTLDKALSSLTAHQWRRIEAASDAYMSRPSLAGCSWQFDAICVVPKHCPKHFPAIWHP